MSFWHLNTAKLLTYLLTDGCRCRRLGLPPHSCCNPQIDLVHVEASVGRFSFNSLLLLDFNPVRGSFLELLTRP